MAQKKYAVVFPIKHNDKHYKNGDSVQMDSETAEPLVLRGILAVGKEDPIPTNSGMPDAVIGQPKPPEGAAQQLTADPGAVPNQGA